MVYFKDAQVRSTQNNYFAINFKGVKCYMFDRITQEVENKVLMNMSGCGTDDRNGNTGLIRKNSEACTGT
jgi:hypothetical protein